MLTDSCILFILCSTFDKTLNHTSLHLSFAPLILHRNQSTRVSHSPPPLYLMATRGVKQLQTLRITYCNYGGSSESVREYIASGKIVEFAKKNPSVQVIGELRNGKHPYIKAEYLSGFPKQVCVKNESKNKIEEVINMLNNSSGRKIKKIEGSTQTDKPSIQGCWTPMLEIVDKKFKIEMITSQP